MNIRTLIVDDEPLARERLRKLLEAEGDFAILEECGDGQRAAAAIEEHRPDVVFLDIQMPEQDGFGVLEAVTLPELPVVVFVTAYSQHAIRAFDVHALDYLLKPFTKSRLKETLARVRERVAQRHTGELNRQLRAVLEEVRGSARGSDRLAVKTGGKVVFVKLADLDWIEAADNYVNLHVGKTSHLLRETMTSIEKRLDSNRFMRISRSAIVNVDRIKEMQPMFHGDYAVILRDGTRLSLSRGHRDKLQKLLGR